MKNAELRSLLPPPPPPKKKSISLGATLFQGGLLFALAAGGFALYRNPGLAHGWIPGLGKPKHAMTAAAAPAARLPGAAQAAFDDEKASAKDDKLTMLDDSMATSAKAAGMMMAPAGDTKKAAEIENAFAQSTAHIGGVVQIAELLSGRPNIMTVKLYAGGKTSRAMAASCVQGSQTSGTPLNESAVAMARFASCYLTTNVERLCSAAQRQVLADVVGHYYATRDFWNRKADEAAHGGKPLKPAQPKPADWSNPVANGISASLRKLVAQGLIARNDFGWLPEEELKDALNGTAVERNICAAAKT